jgi:DNA-binding MarR family transcriptional regulator
MKTTQYSLLSQVLQRGPIRPSDLAKAMVLDASTLTRNLKPLVASGWVSVGLGADSRSHRIAITAAGRAKRAEAQCRWKAAQESLNELLGVERVLALHDLIDGSLQRFAEQETESV